MGVDVDVADALAFGGDLEGLAFFQSDLGLVHTHALGVGVVLGSAAGVGMHERAVPDIGLLAVMITLCKEDVVTFCTLDLVAADGKTCFACRHLSKRSSASFRFSQF